MTTRLSIVHELPNHRWGMSPHPNEAVPCWFLNVAFLRRMWELGQDTILETAFYEPFEKPNFKSRLIDIGYQPD